MALSLSCARKRLTGAGTGPDWSPLGPSGKPEREGPASNAGEEMVFGESFEVIGSHLLNVAFVHLAVRQLPVRNQLPQPRRRERVVFVVVGTHTDSAMSVRTSPIA